MVDAAGSGEEIEQSKRKTAGFAVGMGLVGVFAMPAGVAMNFPSLTLAGLIVVALSMAYALIVPIFGVTETDG